MKHRRNILLVLLPLFFLLGFGACFFVFNTFLSAENNRKPQVKPTPTVNQNSFLSIEELEKVNGVKQVNTTPQEADIYEKISYRMLCNDVQQEGVKPSPDLAFGLFCYVLLHKIWYGIYENVVRQFEKLQINHNVLGRLSMFTPPSTDQEKSDLAWLSGTDTQPPFPRLDSINILTYKLNWYSFNSVEKESNGNFLINVLECKTYYSAMQDPLTNPDLYFTYQRHFVYEINQNKKIVEYYTLPKPQGGNITTKYNGFINY